jgi:uncharacterized protein
MRAVFADSFYWVALTNPNDKWHKRAIEVKLAIEPCRLVTTDEVLDEFLAAFSNHGPLFREAAARVVRSVLGNPNITVLPQSRDSFLQGLCFYEERPDKGYSLTDCISMNAMRRDGLTAVLTHDKHFAQEGFTRLLESEGY